MINIGVQTRGILPDVSIEKGIELIKNAGFDSVDFNLDCFFEKQDGEFDYKETIYQFSTENLNLFFDQYKFEMDQFGVTAAQTHAPYPIWGDMKWEQNDFVQKEVIPKSIAITRRLGARWMVVHSVNMRHAHGLQIEREYNISYFKSLIPILKEYGVGICFENLHSSVGGRQIEGICTNSGEVIDLVDTLNDIAGEELFGVCLDTGHLQVAKRNPVDYILSVGSRLKALHLHENNGVDDLHQMPFTFGYSENDGLDWKGIAKALKQINYQGAIAFETHPCMRAFPDELLLPALQTIYAIGEYIKTEIES